MLKKNKSSHIASALLNKKCRTIPCNGAQVITALFCYFILRSCSSGMKTNFMSPKLRFCKMCLCPAISISVSIGNDTTMRNYSSFLGLACTIDNSFSDVSDSLSFSLLVICFNLEVSFDIFFFVSLCSSCFHISQNRPENINTIYLDLSQYLVPMI